MTSNYTLWYKPFGEPAITVPYTNIHLQDVLYHFERSKTPLLLHPSGGGFLQLFEEGVEYPIKAERVGTDLVSNGLPEDNGEEKWIRDIPRIPKPKNGFDTTLHRYCTDGTSYPLATEEEYHQAKKIVAKYPFNHRILRYQGWDYAPRLYSLYHDIDLWPYITGTQDEVPFCPELRQGESA